MSRYKDTEDFKKIGDSDLADDTPYIAYCQGIDENGEISFIWRRVTYSTTTEFFKIIEKNGYDGFSRIIVKKAYSLPT